MHDKIDERWKWMSRSTEARLRMAAWLISVVSAGSDVRSIYMFEHKYEYLSLEENSLKRCECVGCVLDSRRVSES